MSLLMSPLMTSIRLARRRSHLASAIAFAVVALTTHAHIASADDEVPEGSRRARIPVWSIGLAGGFANRSFDYHIASGFADVPDADGSASQMVGVFGPTASVAIDLDRVVLVGGTTLSVAKPITFEASLGVIGGLRTWTQYAEAISSEYVAPDVVEVEYQTYDVYYPTVFGLYGGAGVYTTSNTTGTGVDSFGYDTTVPVPGGTITTIEGGFGMAGRMSLITAAAFDPIRQAWGGRFRWRWVLGLGSNGVSLGTNIFAMSGGSASDPLPVVHLTIEVGYGDGPGIF